MKDIYVCTKPIETLTVFAGYGEGNTIDFTGGQQFYSPFCIFALLEEDEEELQRLMGSGIVAFESVPKNLQIENSLARFGFNPNVLVNSLFKVNGAMKIKVPIRDGKLTIGEEQRTLLIANIFYKKIRQNVFAISADPEGDDDDDQLSLVF